jgi:hypothetical protein
MIILAAHVQRNMNCRLVLQPILSYRVLLIQHVHSHHSFNQGLRQYCKNDTILLTNCRTYNSSKKPPTQNCTHKACADISRPQPLTWGRVGIARSLSPTRKCNISTYTTAAFGTHTLACTIMTRTSSNTYNTSKTGCLKLPSTKTKRLQQAALRSTDSPKANRLLPVSVLLPPS